MKPRDLAFAGAGLSCAVLARRFAEAGHRCALHDPRPHIAGNCHTARDAETGVMVHQYGAHIFHTSNPQVWEYVNRFAEFGPYVNRVKAVTPRGVYGLPINLLTLCQFFGKALSPREAEALVAEKAAPFRGKDDATFEGVALGLVGEELYRNFFQGYTQKHWGCDPKELPGDVIKRLPLRFNYDDNYFRDPFQGIPRDGYTALIGKMLDHPNITVHLGTAIDPAARPPGHLFWSGPLDAYYGHRHGRLRYRTVFWETARHDGDFQGNAVINYTAAEVPHTRIVEHKHFTPWEDHPRTVVSTEFSKETGPGDTPFYPLRLAADLAILRRYAADAEKEQGVTFVGRLGSYRYLDMNVVVEESLRFADAALPALAEGKPLPPFSVPVEKVLG